MYCPRRNFALLRDLLNWDLSMVKLITISSTATKCVELAFLRRLILSVFGNDQIS